MRPAELALLSAILLLALVLRVGWPTITEFKFSEARLQALALEVTREGRLPLVGVPSSAGFDHSPISVYLYVLPFLLSTDPVPATVYGGLVGVAAVALVWWVGRTWPGGGRWAALIAALLIAVSPWAVVFSRKIWQVVFVPALALAFVGWMIAALVEGRRWCLAWAVVTYAILVQVHPSALSLAPAVALWLVVYWREIRLGPLLLGGVLGLLTATPFVIHQVQSGLPALAAYRALPDAVWDLSAARLAWDAITGLSLHTLAGAAYPLLRIVPSLEPAWNVVGWLALAAVAGLACGSVRGWRSGNPVRRRSARVDLILLTWLLVPIAYNLRHSLDLYLHFFILVAPVAYLLIGRAGEALLSAARPTSVRQALKIGTWLTITVLAAAQLAGLAMMGRFVATQNTTGGFGTPLARYLAVANAAIVRAQEIGAAEVLVVGEGDSPVVNETPAIFDALLRGRTAVRFVDGSSTALFPDHPAVVLLAPGTEPLAAVRWYEPWPALDVLEDYRILGLDGSWPQEGLEAVVGARLFQNGLELQGYAWQDNAATQRSRLWLLWQVLWRDARDTHFFVRLIDGAGVQRGQQDVAGYPLVGRSRGDRVLIGLDITHSPELPRGTYGAQVGQYLYPQVLNVPVIDAAGQPVADAVLLGPLDLMR